MGLRMVTGAPMRLWVLLTVVYNLFVVNNQTHIWGGLVGLRHHVHWYKERCCVVVLDAKCFVKRGASIVL
eukprot:67375-Rhodomonas_salina.1